MLGPIQLLLGNIGARITQVDFGNPDFKRRFDQGQFTLSDIDEMSIKSFAAEPMFQHQYGAAPVRGRTFVTPPTVKPALGEYLEMDAFDHLAKLPPASRFLDAANFTYQWWADDDTKPMPQTVKDYWRLAAEKLLPGSLLVLGRTDLTSGSSDYLIGNAQLGFRPVAGFEMNYSKRKGDGRRLRLVEQGDSTKPFVFQKI
jgi:hypothetical protein